MTVNAVFSQLVFGDHVCCPVRSAEQRWAVAAAGTTCGLRQNQKLLFYVDDPGGLHTFLANTVPGAEQAMASRQLEVHPAGGAYGPGGFDGDAVLEFAMSQIELAHRQGFAGLRSTGDLTAMIRNPRDTDAIIDYERRTNGLFTTEHYIGICHYNPDDFAASTWHRVLAAHPTTLPPDGADALARLRGTRTATGIELVGTVDLLNHAALPALLSGVAALPGDVRIDVTGLEFADAQAITCLLRTAAHRIHRPTTIACTARLAELLSLCGAASVPGLTMVVDR